MGVQLYYVCEFVRVCMRVCYFLCGWVVSLLEGAAV